MESPSVFKDDDADFTASPRPRAGQPAPQLFPAPVLQRLIEQDGITVSVLFRPADFISGDIYDLRQLDGRHLGIYVADATGHSVPAALLNVYLRRAIQEEKQKESSLDQPLDAAGLLSRLNTDLVKLYDEECHFIAMIYAVVNVQTGAIQFARAGLPYPILHRASRRAEICPVEGTVTGLFEDTQYESVTVMLERGDSLVIYSDGVEELLRGTQTDDPDTPPDQWVRNTPWFADLRTHGPESAARWLCARLDEAGGFLKSKDDLTLLVISRNA
jgi:sigma-B regulation protein RsbU (phosphoserine phosphatase)